MLNRAALILRYRQGFVDWINAVDPASGSHALTLVDTEEERTVYLVEVEDRDDLDRWLAQHYKEIFEEELNGWYTDPALWPRDRSLKKLAGHPLAGHPLRPQTAVHQTDHHLDRLPGGDRRAQDRTRPAKRRAR